MRRLKSNGKFGIAGLAILSGVIVAGAATADKLHAADPLADPTPKAAHTGDGAAASNTPLTEEQKIVHALNRMGFGPRPGDVEKVRDMGLAKYIDSQLHPESIDDSVVERKLTSFTTLTLSGDDLSRVYFERNKNAKKAQALYRQIAGADAAEKSAPGSAMTDGAMAAMAPGGAAMANGAAPTGVLPADDAASLRQRAMANATPEQREQMRTTLLTTAKSAQEVNNIELQSATAKTIRAVESERQLQEVMVDFWGNHFNIDTRKAQCATLKTADDRDVIRPHALGKFRDLLEASAKSPAMLVYLDNYQSTSPHAPLGGAAMYGAGAGQGALLRRRFARGGAGGAGAQAAQRQLAAQAAKGKAGGLNENYGREIMELHTLGVDGGYSQKDVTEVARCFTGWSLARIPSDDPSDARKFEIGGTFHFYPFLHDDGPKTVLGKTIPAGGGTQDGETVLDMLASNPATIRHISTELCVRFVSDTPPPSLVDKCVATWKQTDGDIREIVRTILTSPEFYSRAAYEKKIKSPFEFAVSSVRALGGTCDADASDVTPARRRIKKDGVGLYGDQTLLGQISTMGEPVFQYQAPTGYPEDSHKWVSSGALISRLNFSLALANGKLMQVQLPDLDQEVAGLTGPAQIVDRLGSQILHAPVSASTRRTLLAQVTDGESAAGDAHAAASDLSLTRRLTALVIGSPEFQRR